MRNLILAILCILISDSQGQSPLCASRPTSFCCEYVSSITINGRTFQGSTGFSASSGGSPAGYYDYTYTKDTVPRIRAGQSITISYTGVTSSNFMEYFKLWIDFNGNGVLTDPGELVHSFNTSWSGTKSFTSSFTVPTSVYNGEVYMRFVMQYSGSPVICGTYPYGNTFDFKTRIVGATDPFSYSGYIYDSEGKGISGIEVDLYSKLKSSQTYSFLSSVKTGNDGKYELSSNRDATLYDFELRIGPLSIPNPSTSDVQGLNSKIFSQSPESKDYYRMDVNTDNRLNIADIFQIYMKIRGKPWNPGTPDYRIFTSSEWLNISGSNSNLRSSYPGSQSIQISGISNKGNSDYYLVRTGWKN
jgi:hypothetical protein